MLHMWGVPEALGYEKDQETYCLVIPMADISPRPHLCPSCVSRRSPLGPSSRLCAPPCTRRRSTRPRSSPPSARKQVRSRSRSGASRNHPCCHLAAATPFPDGTPLRPPWPALRGCARRLTSSPTSTKSPCCAPPRRSHRARLHQGARPAGRQGHHHDAARLEPHRQERREAPALPSGLR
jgi:hypothetical protein